MNKVSLAEINLTSSMTGVMHPIAERISVKYHSEIPHWRLYQILAEFSGEVVREFVRIGNDAPFTDAADLAQE